MTQSIKRSFLSVYWANRWAKFMARGLAVMVILAVSCSQVPLGQDTAALTKVAQASELTVFRSPTCGCCSKWADHMKAFGFQVKDMVTEDMTAVEQQYGVPNQLRSCHTAIANGYVIEGHIPALDVARFTHRKTQYRRYRGAWNANGVSRHGSWRLY